MLKLLSYLDPKSGQFAVNPHEIVTIEPTGTHIKSDPGINVFLITLTSSVPSDDRDKFVAWRGSITALVDYLNTDTIKEAGR